MTRIIEQGDEPELQVEVAGRVIDRVNFNNPNADLIGQEFDSSLRIHQEERAQSAAMGAPVYRESSEEHDWDVDLRQSLGLVIRQVLATNSVG